MCMHSGDCPAGQYFDDSCKDCEWPCNTCSSLSTCTSCSYEVAGDNAGRTLLLYNDFCYSVCPEHTMKVGLFCEDCD